MPSIFDRDGGKRWPRSQRFCLSAKGADAERQYREMIIAARDEAGRTSFDAARSAWAVPLQVQPEDGLYLGELQAGARTLDEITKALDSCGSTKRDVKAAVERLSNAGLIEAVAPPSPTPVPPRSPLWR